MKRIVHVNLSDAYQEPCGQAVKSLMDCQSAAGHDVCMFVERKTGNDPRVIPLPRMTGDWRRQLKDREKETGLPELYSTGLLPLLKHPRFAQADLVHLHITGEYFSHLLFPYLTGKPLIWTLYNAQSYCAGCRHSTHCFQWVDKDCADCPLDRNRASQTDRPLLQRLRRQIYQTCEFTVVCPHEFVKSQTAQSILKDKESRLIRPGVDLDVFRFGDPVVARKTLGLPLDKKIVLFVAAGAFQQPVSGGPHLLAALELLRREQPDLYRELYLVNIGAAGGATQLDQLELPRRDLEKLMEPQIMAAYFRAADVLAYPAALDIYGATVMEAAACGLPAVAFGLGAVPELIVQEKTGYLAPFNDNQEFARGLELFLNKSGDPTLRYGVRERAAAAYNIWRTAAEYDQLYDELTGNVSMSKATVPVMGWKAEDGPPPEIQPNNETLASVAEKMSITAILDAALSKNWENVWRELDRIFKAFGERERERGIAVDVFCYCLLERVDVKVDGRRLWEIMAKWLYFRKIPPRCGHFTPVENLANLTFLLTMRQVLTAYFQFAPVAEFQRLGPVAQTAVINFWKAAFFNGFSTINLQTNREEMVPMPEMKEWYPHYLLQTMYQNYAGRDISIDTEKLLTSKLPIAVKVVILFWLINTPYYCADEDNLSVMLKHSEEFCRAAVKHPQTVSKGFFFGAVDQLTPNFWRASYIGGNNIKQLSAYGDFLRTHMERNFPAFKALTFKNHRKKGERLRIGYISSNFCRQAVAFYMINRFLHRDPSRFEVVTFLLEKRIDDMTDMIREHSDKFITFKEENTEVIAQRIVDEQLDILIYTDIGMEQVTYKLGALRLAPVQCVLVGHGVTTGLSTIDYYVGGDFEPADAETHYREKLVRLPNLGAAQYPPEMPEEKPKRAKFNLPDDAVILVSCANGIKHGPERDRLLVEILQRVPNAVIVLKPFMTPALADKQFLDRMQTVAVNGGVQGRLIVAPPLSKSTDLMGLLMVADIQLDTYPYGGWTTNMEALYAGLPLVTQEGGMARNRWGAAMLRALGIQEGIAATEQEYVEQAVRLATDAELRNRIRDQVRNNVQKTLFNGPAAQKDYEDFLCTAYAERIVSRSGAKNHKKRVESR
ncbi:MAG TPA: glycosyltransferase [Patescibacteria group bacterium]|nr:glycosyltransferase [Patescibacteria group bacterium]